MTSPQQPELPKDASAPPGVAVTIEALTDDDLARFEAACATDESQELTSDEDELSIFSKSSDNDAALRQLQAGPHYIQAAPMLPELKLSVDSCRPAPIKEVIIDGGACFVIHNALSAAECAAVIAAAEATGLRSINDSGYPEHIRVTSKVPMWGFSLAGELFERISPFLDTQIMTVGKDDGISEVGIDSQDLSEGKYVPYGCNPTVRICRYRTGGHFVPHRDFGYVIQKGENFSIKTVMIYLSDEFEGGATSFYTDEQSLYTPGEDKHRTHSFRPKTGDALVFNSGIVHDGGVLTGGTKYILRSELMYRIT